MLRGLLVCTNVQTYTKPSVRKSFYFTSLTVDKFHLQATPTLYIARVYAGRSINASR
jgi:hypothetical protein